MYQLSDLEALKRAELVKIAKSMGIKANGKTVDMIASIIEQQPKEVQTKTEATSPKEKSEKDGVGCWASPELREMSYNEVRSIAKATPGVKAKGTKVDLIAAIAAVNECEASAFKQPIGSWETSVVDENEAVVEDVDSPTVFTAEVKQDAATEDECIRELEKLMLADLYEEEDQDSEVWDMLKVQEVAKDISNESMTEDFVEEAQPSRPAHFLFEDKENTVRNKNKGKKMSSRNKKKLREKKLENQKIEITRSCFLSPNSFAKLQTGNAPTGMTANEAGGGVFSPASRANMAVLKELLG
ncbi:hypothetical protein TrVE_jg8287 [Triparma verrucosa]|uniref:Uncharacterized protein n=1 Tax=Triparma verrucosa TaxID=1606542 RepID=A0A9W7DLP6_9STRA|nr:hypothetical protein TrVE_jg8287 [Triparma verrucosa]